MRTFFITSFIFLYCPFNTWALSEYKISLEENEFNQIVSPFQKMETREIYFFDDPSLSYFKQGILFRLRKSKENAELTVKLSSLAQIKFNELKKRKYKKFKYKCEKDELVFTAEIRSCSLSYRFKLGDVAITTDFLQKEQISLVAEYLNINSNIVRDNLARFISYGPIYSTYGEIKDSKKADRSNIYFEKWDFKNKHYYEISVKGHKKQRRMFIDYLERNALEPFENQMKSAWALLEHYD